MEKKRKQELGQVDRRQFLRLMSAYGMTATVGGMLGAPFSADAQEIRQRVIAQAAKEKEKKKVCEIHYAFRDGRAHEPLAKRVGSQDFRGAHRGLATERGHRKKK